MLNLTFLPKNIQNWLQVLKPMFRERHYLVFAWIIVCQAVCQEKATLAGLARIAPSHIKVWHFRRLLKAQYWYFRALLWWFADHAIRVLTPPEDGILYMIFDSTVKDKTGKNHPTAKKSRLNKLSPYIFGIHIVILVLHWGNYRIPVDFEIVRRKDDPKYRKENSLARWMLIRFTPPDWATHIIVTADAAFASKENLKLIKRRGYFYVMSLARTWKFEDGKSLKNLVQHLPKKFYRKTWIIDNKGNRRVYWTYTTKVYLRHLGEVTIVLSKKRHNQGPKRVKILVTNLPNAKGRQVVAVYTKRWWVEVVIKELKSGIGLGQHQVTKDVNRVEKSIAIAVITYLTIVKFRVDDIPNSGTWGIFTLKHNFMLEIVKEQYEHSGEKNLRKRLKQDNLV